MDYPGFQRKLQEKKLEIFTLYDIEALYPQNNPKTIKNNLHNWVKKGHIQRIKKNMYLLQEKNIPAYYLANKLYQPSYISHETALSFYNLIPEETAHTTSTTTKPTRTIKNKHGTFTYHTIKKKAYTGYKPMKIQGYKTLIAEPEKALADFIYHRNRQGQKDYEGERFNKKQLNKISHQKTMNYAKKLNKKTQQTIKQILKK